MRGGDRRGSARVGPAVVIALLLMPPVLPARASDTPEPTLAERLHAHYLTRRVRSIHDIAAAYERDQQALLPQVPPEPGVVRVYGGVLPYAEADVSAAFLEQLPPPPDGGIARHAIQVREDTATRERVLWNAEGAELGRADPPVAYDPHAYAAGRFAEFFLDGGRYRERLAAIFEPGRIRVVYDLVRESDLAAYAEAQAAEMERLAPPLGEAVTPGPGVAFVEIGEDAGDPRFTMAWPADAPPAGIDVFASPEIRTPAWQLILTALTHPEQQLFTWVDLDAGSEPSQFYEAWSLEDRDGDGIPDGRELRLYGTDPDRWDSDGDGLSDFEEIYIYGTDPLKADTAGDGLSDGWKVRLGLDPRAPAQTGEAGLRLWTPMRKGDR